MGTIERVFDELKFAIQVCINKLHLCPEFQLSISNISLIKQKIAKCLKFAENGSCLKKLFNFPLIYCIL